jgi:hypothetical protein
MEYKKSRFWIMLIVTITLALLLALVDTSPHWNDTGVTVGLLLMVSFVCGAIMPKYAWLWALIIGSLLFLLNVVHTGTYGSAGAIIFCFAGAYAGVFCKRVLIK